jgi:hypothetical protein
MARNGSGTYNLPAGNPVVTGTTISSTTTNNTFSDIATALTGSISADGQTTPTGNLPMGGYKHTNVADATVRAQYATAGQSQDSAFTFLTSPSGTNTITATASLGMSAYATGQRFFFVAPAANTGAVTLNINAIGAKSVTKNGTTALVANDIAINAVAQVVYDGTQFQLLNPTAAANVSSFSAGTTGLTPSTATTGAVTLAGTLAVANGGTGLATLTANNVMLGNGTSTPSFVAPSTTGNVLTSNGTTWQSTAPTGSMTLLGTITPTAVNSVSLGSLVLTGYKSLYIVINNIAITTAKTCYISSTNRQSGGGFLTTTSGVGVSGTAWLDLGTGALGGGTSDNTISSSAALPVGGLTNVDTSTTTLSFRISSSNNFVAQGTIVIYGVK